jgi:Cft2 family RNA processing exonuclease
MAWRILLHNGIHLPARNLYCDARRKVDLSFISHAHSDHIGAHRRVLCSEPTRRLMQSRLRGQREEWVEPFGEPFALDSETKAILYPAGHILGSSQLWLRHDNESFLYTGDFKLRPNRAAEICATPRADVLVMETTFGLPRYTMPPEEIVLAELIAFCRDALESKAVPVLFAYSLGKSQELLRALDGSGLPIMLPPETIRMTRLYESFGYVFPAYREWDPDAVASHVVICPPMSKSAALLAETKTPRRTAMVSGWALEPGATYRFQCDAAFPLSDHADYPDLLRFVELVQPKKVYTVHGFAQEFAATLRSRGVEAWALGQDNQMEIPF